MTSTTVETTSTADLAAFAHRTDLSAVPIAVRARAKLLMLDSLGCALGGAHTDIAAAAYRAVAEPAADGVTCIGRPERLTPTSAAFLNATFSNALDWDDDNGVGHPSATVLPSALAAAERVEASGERFLLAYILGYEANSRLGRALWPSPERYEAVWGVGTHQVFGAAIAAAKLLGLDEYQTLNAIGIAGAAAAVPSAQKWNWESRPLGWVKDAVAWPAQNGLMAARLASQDFEAARDILDGDRGFWIMASSDQYDAAIVSEALGERWFVGESATKPYPSCRFTHSALEAVERIVEDNGLTPDDVAEVVIRSVSDLAGYLTDGRPHSSVDAQFSADFTAALVIAGVTPGPDWFAASTLSDPQILAIAERIRVLPDGEADREFHANLTKIPASAELRTTDGRILRHAVDYPAGEVENPIADEAVRAKFLSLASPVIGTQNAERVMALVDEVETLIQVTELTKLLTKP